MTENTTTATEKPVEQAAQPIIERTFELAIYDITVGDSGKEEYRKVAFPEPVTVTACSQSELQGKLALFSQCGQMAKVVRVIEEKTINNGNVTKQPPTVTNNIEHSVDVITAPITQTGVQMEKSHTTQQTISSQSQLKPRYFKVGDIEVKDDNGKIYQKQWMRLSESEAANIRVINDKNNATINLNGKHFEMKKWVLVENSEESDETAVLEENLK